MRKTVKNIGKIISIYIISVVILNFLIAICIKQFYYKNYTYLNLLTRLLCNNIPTTQIFINTILAAKKLIESIALAILTSFIFSYILNREIKVIFPDKITLRKRTSEGSEGKLTLGILIGNPGKRELLDVKCTLHCTYLKHIGEIERRNGETYLNYTVDSIQNYFRFSFDVNSLPKKFWQHYIEKDEKYINKDFLIIAIMGKTDGLGGYFRVTKRYSLQDIIVDLHEPEKYFKKKTKNIFTSKEKIKIDWKEFPKCIEAGEKDRHNIILEIHNYVKE